MTWLQTPRRCGASSWSSKGGEWPKCHRGYSSVTRRLCLTRLLVPYFLFENSGPSPRGGASQTRELLPVQRQTSTTLPLLQEDGNPCRGPSNSVPSRSTFSLKASDALMIASLDECHPFSRCLLQGSGSNSTPTGSAVMAEGGGQSAAL